MSFWPWEGAGATPGMVGMGEGDVGGTVGVLVLVADGLVVVDVDGVWPAVPEGDDVILEGDTVPEVLEGSPVQAEAMKAIRPAAKMVIRRCERVFKGGFLSANGFEDT